MSGLVARVGGVPTKVTVTLQVVGRDTPLVFEQQVPNSPLPRDVAVDFKTSYPVTQLRLAVQSVNDAEPAHVHLWEVTFR